MRSRGSNRGERVPRRDAVRRCAVEVDTEELAEECREALSVHHRVAAAAPITECDVEIAVGTERDLPSVVVLERLIDPQDLRLARHIRPVRIAC